MKQNPDARADELKWQQSRLTPYSQEYETRRQLASLRAELMVARQQRSSSLNVPALQNVNPPSLADGIDA